MNEIQKLETWRRDLALSETFEEIKLHDSAAAAAAEFARREHLHLDKQNEIGRFRIEVEAKKGRWLEENYPHGATVEKPRNTNFKFTDGQLKMPATPKESTRARTIAESYEAAPEKMEAVMIEIEKKGEVITPNAVSKELKRESIKQEQTQRFEILEQKAADPIVSNYDVIVIDPPWKMEKIQREVAPLQIGFDYPTMDIQEIKDFKLPAAENCHVFMWITHKHLPFGFDIFKEWNVKYVCCFVWHKNGGFQPFGLPQYNCEFILYGRIGTPEFFDLKDFNVCFNANRTGHSEKPEAFYSMIKRVTAGARIDIFSRRKIEGFDNFGNEAKNE